MAGGGVLGRALRRFWALAVGAGLIAGLASWWAITTLTPTTYSGAGLYLVRTATAAQSLVGSSLPGSPAEAEELARVYELLLVDDTELLGNVSAATGVPTEDLREQVVPESVPGTPAIRVTFTGETPQEVRGFFVGLTEVLDDTGSEGLTPGSLRELQQPTEVEQQSGLTPVAPFVGLLAGLLVGLGGAVLLERLDRRVLSAADLRELTTRPVFDTRRTGGSARLETAALRAARAGRRSVAVVTTLSERPEITHAVAEQLDDLPGSVFDGLPAPEWLSSGRLGTDGAAEQAVMESAATLVVVTRLTSARVVEDALRSVADTGVDDVFVLLHDPVGPPATDSSAGLFDEGVADEHQHAPVGGEMPPGALAVDSSHVGSPTPRSAHSSQR